MSGFPKCTYELREQGVAYPRTCAECGLGPCKAGHFTPTPKPASEADQLRSELAAVRASRDELARALRTIVDLDDGDSPALWHYMEEFNAARAALARAGA